MWWVQPKEVAHERLERYRHFQLRQLDHRRRCDKKRGSSRSEVRIRHVNNIARHREPSWDLNERNWNEHRHIFFTKGDAVSPSNASPNELVHREAWCPMGWKLELIHNICHHQVVRFRRWIIPAFLSHFGLPLFQICTVEYGISIVQKWNLSKCSIKSEC